MALVARPARWSMVTVVVACVLVLCALVVGSVQDAGASSGREADPVSTSALVQSGRELAAGRSVTSRTFRVAKGAYVTRVYGAAVHERRAGGGFGRLEPGLVRRGEGYGLDAGEVAVRFPAGLDAGAVRLSRGGAESG
jgi:hypothetical protein